MSKAGDQPGYQSRVKNLPKPKVRVDRRKTEAPAGSVRAEAYQHARRVRAEMPRVARQADVAKALNVTRQRLEQLEVEVLAKLVMAMAREDTPEGVDVAGLRKRIGAVVPGVREYLHLMSGASLELVAEIVEELSQDHGSVFPATIQ